MRANTNKPKGGSKLVAGDTSPRRTVMRYFGGKWILAPWIIEHFPGHRVYVEPYGGVASVLMRKTRAYAEVYNDLDGEVVNVFQVLQDLNSAGHLKRQLKLTPFSRKEFIKSYGLSSDPIERARRTIVRSFMGFGANAVRTDGYKTGFRADSNRSGTTPAHDWMNYPDQIKQFTERLRGVVIENRPALQIINQFDACGRNDTLFYVDPPYVQTARGKSIGYTHEMDDGDHINLLKRLVEVRNMVVLSGYQNDLYEAHLPDWICYKKDVYADGARPRVECLWLNPLAQEQLRAEQVQTEIKF